MTERIAEFVCDEGKIQKSLHVPRADHGLRLRDP